MAGLEKLWFFDESKEPICASFCEDIECDRDQCIFSHDEPIYSANVSIPQEVLQDLTILKSFLQSIGINSSRLIVPLFSGSSLQNGIH